jgi:hypothetical protein
VSGSVRPLGRGVVSYAIALFVLLAFPPLFGGLFGTLRGEGMPCLTDRSAHLRRFLPLWRKE